MAVQAFGFVVLLFCLLAAAFADKKCAGTATYMIDFMGTWNSMSHPNFPDGAKFSPLAGCSHSGNYLMWDADVAATAGVQDVAERGNASRLHYEIKMQKAQGNAYMYTEGNLFDSPGESKSYIRVSSNFTMVSLISMIIPSPDWFVGVKKMQLCGSDGKWMEMMEMDLQPWDAGSKDGTTFAFSQVSTDPQENIKIITKEDDTPFKGAQDIASLGKITLKRICDGKQTYALKFQGNWNREDHPADFPSNAHFSPLVGASHSAMYKFWEAGGMASPGVKQVAEAGATSILKAELMAKKNMDPKYVLQIFQGRSLSTPGEDTVKVEVDGIHSRVSAISMLAPSPDWFVGIDSLDLCDKWTWRDVAVRDNLPPWDSGTDSGKTFRSPNQRTDPPAKIAIIVNTEDTSLKSAEPIKSLGKFVFTREFEPEMSSPRPWTTQPSVGSTGEVSTGGGSSREFEEMSSTMQPAEPTSEVSTGGTNVVFTSENFNSGVSGVKVNTAAFLLAAIILILRVMV